jgi:predicted component of type VI protein secretion system
MACALLAAAIVLSGCGFKRNQVLQASQVSSEQQQPRHVAVIVVATAHANVGVDGRPLPVRACLIRAVGAWEPPRAHDGLPCTGLVRGKEVVDLQASVLPPGHAMRHVLELPNDSGGQLIVGAEFVQSGAGRSWQIIALPASGEDDIVVLLDDRAVYVPSRGTP